ncbi:MAG: hypothetical protein IPJ16_05940 [Bacteroidales bacterium]|nr:hypothetical protein [Bacteroidales bacterium]
MKAMKIFSLLTVFILSSFSLYGQHYLIGTVPASNQYPITFSESTQTKLLLTFTKNVTPGANISQVGWSVSGTAATISQIDAAGVTVQITLNTTS